MFDGRGVEDRQETFEISVRSEKVRAVYTSLNDVVWLTGDLQAKTTGHVRRSSTNRGKVKIDRFAPDLDDAGRDLFKS